MIWRRIAAAACLPLRIVALVAGISAATAALQAGFDADALLQNLVTFETTGFVIAWACNLAQPWERRHTLAWMIAAVSGGAVLGVALSMGVKLLLGLRAAGYYRDHFGDVAGTTLFLAWHSMLVCAIVVYQLLDRRRQAALHFAEIDQAALARQTVEAELKLLQAQVEPHFLFNTLSNLQFLVETDPPAAARMLQHLSTYLRAAIPQLRQASSTLGREIQLVQAYLAIFEMRLGARLRTRIDVPEDLSKHTMPAMLLLTLVENAIQHGVEPSADGGEVRLEARRNGQQLQVSVTDTGQGLSATPGQGVGLANIRDRLQRLYGDQARLTLTALTPRGVRATLELPAMTD